MENLNADVLSQMKRFLMMSLWIMLYRGRTFTLTIFESGIGKEGRELHKVRNVPDEGLIKKLEQRNNKLLKLLKAMGLTSTLKN